MVEPELMQLWVEQYRTGSGSDRVQAAIYNYPATSEFES